MNQLALDRSVRSVDADGHLRVEFSRISKANVCGYKGYEIPRAKELGLIPDKTYYLLRDPRELAKAADTFTGKPLLIRHVPIDADLPSQSLWVGTVGAVSWEAPYLVTRPLMVLTQEAIDLIESEKQRELSAGYRYDAQMSPGTYGGQRYDGIMVNIRGNHVAIVSEGRVGPDVHVADEQPLEFRRMSRIVRTAAVLSAITPFLAANADKEAVAVALDGELGEVPTSVGTADEELTDKEKKDAADEYCKEKGMDAAEMKDDDREMAYNKARDKKARDKKRGKDAKGKDSSTSTASGNKNGAGDADVDHRDDFKGGKDSAITQDQVNQAVKAGADLVRKQMRDAGVAREAVRPLVGLVPMAMDSADEIYAFALKHAGVKTEGVHSSAFPALLDVVVKKTPAKGGAPRIGMDSSQHDLADIDAIFRA